MYMYRLSLSSNCGDERTGGLIHPNPCSKYGQYFKVKKLSYIILRFKPKPIKMKKMYLPLAAMLIFVFTACNNPGTSSSAGNTKDSAMSSTEQQNLEKNRSMYKAIQAGDSATIKSLVADDAVDHQDPGGHENY
ncbi:MAG: hypothetical protein ACXV2C_07075 [Candidatus Bathyarchaeia archaeon]